MRGLCLSGGGIKAAAHIGALKAFEEKEIEMPLLIPMVDMRTGIVYIASSKEVRASCSFPVVFCPCSFQNMKLIEGIDNLITINLKKVSLLDAKKSEELYKIGYEQTKKQIEKYALH